MSHFMLALLAIFSLILTRNPLIWHIIPIIDERWRLRQVKLTFQNSQLMSEKIKADLRLN